MMKKDLRRALLAQRSAIAADMRAQYDAALNSRVISWWKHHPVRSLGVYSPIRGEPDLNVAYAELTRHGVELSLPLVADANTALQFMKWAPGDALVAAAMNVPVPTPPHILAYPEALLIPCVGFNRQYVRLGYGGGYYDRTLAVTPRPLAVGIAYSCALVEFDAAQHDVALDMIITEDNDFLDSEL
jgi:5-formyltetrahydrofolate cyclo-ligase